jgi:4-amino-4-deoxy-L-arabinose transferase-like glycosyltransferase
MLAALKNMKTENKFIFFSLIGWTIVNLIQASLLDIHPDEAYYQFMSQELHWGYLDHPPVIFFLIKLGSWVFPHELGVRLPSVVMSSLSIYLLWRITDSGDPKLFLKIILSIIAVHTMAFHAFPDIPLVFFCLVYLIFLKKYLASDSLALVLPISLSMALMFMTKYTAILIPPATLIAAPSILKRRSFWLISFLTLLFLIPHIAWQFETDFASLRLHLVYRGLGQVFSVKTVLRYVISQPLMVGPIVGFLLIFIAVKYPAQNSFERVLKSIMFVVYGFFFVNSFKVRIAQQWTALAVLPVIVLGVKRIQDNPDLRAKCHKFLNVSFVLSLVLFTVVRVFLAFELIPHQYVKAEYLHGFRNWARNIQTAAQGCPVVFVDTWEQPSRYRFYTREYAHVLSTLAYRRSHFDFTDEHRALLGTRVMLINVGESVLEPGNNKKYVYEFRDHFATYPGINLTSREMEYSPGKEDRVLAVPLRITRNPYSPRELGLCKTVLSYGLLDKGGVVVSKGELDIGLPQMIEAKDWVAARVRIPDDLHDVKYVRFGLKSDAFPATLNSETIKVRGLD